MVTAAAKCWVKEKTGKNAYENQMKKKINKNILTTNKNEREGNKKCIKCEANGYGYTQASSKEQLKPEK